MSSKLVQPNLESIVPSVISVEKVSKAYSIYERPHDPLLREFYLQLAELPVLPRFIGNGLRGLAKRRGKQFYALKEISFRVASGESLGIIGRNGSGKSTLLQLIVGTLSPTNGEINSSGRIAALLELGTGFNPEFTGFENVYLTASLMGLTKKEIDASYKEIVTFADIGSFIDQPVKTYSSGMLVRLAFAVQMAVDPEILNIDEALSVGDFFFQQKCTQRLRELRSKGTTLLFVSHDMGIVRDLCDQAVYLRNGELVYHGPCHQAIKAYLNEGFKPVSVRKTIVEDSPPEMDEKKKKKFSELAYWMSNSQQEKLNGVARILGVALLDSGLQPTTKVTMGKELKVWILVQHYSVTPVQISFIIKNRYNQVISSFGSYTLDVELPDLKEGKLSLFELNICAMIEAGAYTFRASVGQITKVNRGMPEDQTPWLGPFTVFWDYEKNRAPFHGMFGVPVAGEFKSVEDIH